MRPAAITQGPPAKPRITACDSTHPVELVGVSEKGVAFLYGQQRAVLSSADQECVAYVVVNREPNQSLRVRWDDVINLAPGAALAPDPKNPEALAWACGDPVKAGVCKIRLARPGTVEQRTSDFAYGRDLQTHFLTATYQVKEVSRPANEAVATETRIQVFGGVFTDGPLGAFLRIDLRFVSAVSAGPDARYITQIRPGNKESLIPADIKVQWYPRTDKEFAAFVKAPEIGRPYAVPERGFDVSWRDYRRPAVPAVIAVRAAIFIADRPFLVTDVPAVIPVIPK